MAVNSNTVQTYAVTTLRDDLQDALISISPDDAPLMQAAGTKDVSNTLFEWPVTELASVNSSNRVIEGEAAPGNDAATLPVRVQNYVQLSDKVVETSSTNEAVNGAANAQTMAEQMALKLRELKRDMETMLCANTAASAGTASAARATAGLSAFLITNVDKHSGGTAPTTSGTGAAGYPNAAYQNGTLRTITEAMLNNVVQLCWTEGADPSMVLVGPAIKQKISSTFTGNSTRYKEADDKRISGAVDFIVTDFGELQVVPSRFSLAREAYVLDPNYLRVCYLQTTKQEDLAKTGHSERKLISCEYGLQVDAEKSQGAIRDIQAS